MNKKTKLGLLGLVAIFAFFVIFRVFYQKGAKLLEDLYPWNYIALAVIVVLLIVYFVKAMKASKKGGAAEEEVVGKKKPILTSNQIGLAAAFGGAAFAFRALGIAVPVVPPLTMDPGALMPCLAGMCGGPVVGALVGIARGIPSGSPAVDLWVQPIKGIYWYFVWKQIIKIENEKKRWVVFGVTTLLLQFFVEQVMSIAGNAFILGLYDFYPTWPWTLGWYAVVYSVFQFVVFAAVIKAFPGMFGWKTSKNKLKKGSTPSAKSGK